MQQLFPHSTAERLQGGLKGEASLQQARPFPPPKESGPCRIFRGPKAAAVAQAAAVQEWGNSPVAGPCNWELTRGRVEGDELRHFGDIL